jgi:multiple sugar transport system ATP-binding protein
MGRAIVRDPQVFLFDEPLSNLDAKLRVAMRSEIKELHQRLQTTSIYVTHDQIEAMTMGDQIVVMRDGRIEQTGSPLELYDFPANQFVAGFIGSPAMNFLPGKLLVNAGQCQVELHDGLKLNLPHPVKGQHGQPVVFGTRPEHLSLADSGGITAQVAVMEPTGMDTFVACRHEGVEFSAVFRERHEFQLGSTINLQPDMNRAHVFDAATGIRLVG